VPENRPVSEIEITSVESALGIELPQSYRTFITVLGPGMWCDEVVMAPSALYAFDADCAEMEGFIALVENVKGIGDYLAINPTDAVVSGERPLYYCGHDPFGSARLADSFEMWTRTALDARRTDASPYDSIRVAVTRASEHSHDTQRKQWWQFWRR